MKKKIKVVMISLIISTPATAMYLNKIKYSPVYDINRINMSRRFFAQKLQTRVFAKRNYGTCSRAYKTKSLSHEKNWKGNASNMSHKKMSIDIALVRHLVDSQFPEFNKLPIIPVRQSGWDNKTFHLGNNMLVRMPSAEPYADQVKKEQHWLPKLAPHLPYVIPSPLRLGKPTDEYPWHWSVYNYISGTTAAQGKINDISDFAKDLARFLLALEKINPNEGPSPGWHSFFRGGSIAQFDSQTQQAFSILEDKIDIHTARNIWSKALASSWPESPVWVHGDVTESNILVENGKLKAVIDFGILTTGDPACDLAIAWTMFDENSRKVFRNALPFDKDTWIRGQAWSLWKATVISAGLMDAGATETAQTNRVIHEILTDYKKNF